MVPAFRVRIYLGCVYSLGVAGLTVILVNARWDVPQHAHGILIVTVLLLVVGELYPIRLWRQGEYDEYTFSGTFALALLATGPIAYAVIGQLAALLIEEARHRKPPRIVAFNVSQYVLMFVSARTVICALEGVEFGAYENLPGGEHLLSIAVAAPVYFLVNTGLTGAVVALSSGAPVFSSVVKSVREEIPVTPIVLGLAPVVVGSMQFSLWTAPLCLLPIIAVRRAATLAAKHEMAALHDSLTGLANRALLLLRLRQALSQAHAPHGQVALLMLDLDHFKEINDTLGHPVGDELLVLIAARLTEVVRSGDTVARLGGDEFAVVVREASVEAATDTARRIAASLRDAFHLADVSLNVDASIGIALSPDHGTVAESLIRHADVALYTAKQNRDGHSVYDSRSDKNTIERLTLMGQLRRGIEDGELVVYYQPKVSSRTGRVSGVEALVRWQHPTLGLLPPGRFVPAAENTGLIMPLTQRVLDDALDALRQWWTEGLHISVSVNVTARHITNLDLPNQIGAALATHGLPGDALILEVTESSLMSDPGRARTVLHRLRNAGVGLSIDDFGTGYSSFANLRNLPVTEIKVDRSFVSAATASATDAAIVKSTIELGHNLGLAVVAEGIETQECLDMLTAMECDFLQGYYLSEPIPADALTDWATAYAGTTSLPAG